MNFDHLTSKKLKFVLTGKPTDEQIAWAISYTKNCLDDDEHNEDVMPQVLDARLSQFGNAKTLFDIGMYDESLYFLKRTWQI